MAKVANKPPYAGDDQISGIRRSAVPRLSRRVPDAPPRPSEQKAVPLDYGARRPPRAALASGAVLLLLGLWLWSLPSEPDIADANARIVVKSLPLTAAAEPRITSAPARALPPEPAPLPLSNVELEVSASPPEARLSLDGAPLSGNPFRGRFPRDGRLHLVRAEGPGLQHQELGITFDRDRVLRLTLSSTAGSPARARGAVRRTQPEVRDPEPAPRGVTSRHPAAPVPAYDAPLAPRKRSHEIYEEDPYR